MTIRQILAVSVVLNALLLGAAVYFLRSDEAPFSPDSRTPLSAAPKNSPTFAPGAPRPPARDLPVPAGRPDDLAASLPPSSPSVSPRAKNASFPRAEPSSPTSAANEPPVPLPIEPDAPGNSVSFRGMRAAVVENLSGGQGSRPALSVDVTPAVSPASANDAGAADGVIPSSTNPPVGAPPAEAAPDVSVPATVAATPQKRSSMQIFTAEENAFRTRWGWEAFDLMRREAAREAANQAAADY